MLLERLGLNVHRMSAAQHPLSDRHRDRERDDSDDDQSPLRHALYLSVKNRMIANNTIIGASTMPADLASDLSVHA